MKTNIILPVVLLIVIAILGILLGYEITHRHSSAEGADIEQARKQGFETALRGCEQVIINLNVLAYHDAERGDVDGLKRRLVKLLADESYNYTARYGTERSTNFVPILADAKAIAGTLSQTNR
jgi:hypothetical protein